MPEAVVEPGSFRDRSARVFYHAGQVFRGLSPLALQEWETLSSTRFYRRFAENGGLVGSERLDAADVPAGAGEWAAVLRHEKVPFVSYP
jgi:hypothetical protein